MSALRDFFEMHERQAREAELIAGAAAVQAVDPRASEQRCRRIAEAVLDAVAALRDQPLDPVALPPGAGAARR